MGIRTSCRSRATTGRSNATYSSDSFIVDISLYRFSPLGIQRPPVARRDQGLALGPNSWVKGHRQVLDEDQGAELHPHQSTEQPVLIRQTRFLYPITVVMSSEEPSGRCRRTSGCGVACQKGMLLSPGGASLVSYPTRPQQSAGATRLMSRRGRAGKYQDLMVADPVSRGWKFRSAVELSCRTWGRGMRVLVAGDRGYIGAVLVPFLRAAGHEVDGLDLGLYEGCDLGPGPGRRAGARPRRHAGRQRRPAGRLRRGAVPGRAVQRSARAISTRRPRTR